MEQKEIRDFLDKKFPPKQRGWVGLEEEEIKDFQTNRFVSERLIRAIEQRLKEKNPGPRSVVTDPYTTEDYEADIAQVAYALGMQFRKNQREKENQRKWQTLEDDEYQTILGQLGGGGLLAFYVLIENKLREKNSG